MITIKNLGKSFGERIVFENFNLDIGLKDKIGIVGKNGIGKTTLIKSILNSDYNDFGIVDFQGHSIGYLNQTAFKDETITLFEEFLNLFPKISQLQKQLNKWQNKELNPQELEAYIKASEKFTFYEGHNLRVKVLKFMNVFGFKEEALDKKIKTFSGGEKTKLMLIKLLLMDPDFLILDEPTNHLDINAIEWLETYLKNFKKGIILISHDQMFLNKVCNKILEINDTGIDIYKTKFDNYLIQSKLNYEIAVRTYEKQQRKIVKYQEFIERNNKKPSKIGQVNDRKAKLEQIQELKKPVNHNKTLNFEFQGLHSKKNTYIDFEQVRIKILNHLLLENFNFKLYAKDKVFLIGANGVGKSTLFKAILQTQKYQGKIKISSQIKIGYFDQEQKNLDQKKTLFEIIEEVGNFDSTTAIRKYLGKFLFTRNEIFKKVDSISGGEKVRLNLAVIALKEYDVLLMDEPTNHLDFETKKILEAALEKFPGSLLIITHDRYLIDKLATCVIEIKNQEALPFFGNWTEFKQYQKKIKELEGQVEQEQKKEEKALKKIDIKKNIGGKKKINVQKMKLIEQDIEKVEAKKEHLLIKLNDYQTHTNHLVMNEVLTELDTIEQQLTSLYETYEKTIT